VHSFADDARAKEMQTITQELPKMRTSFNVVMCAALLGLFVSSPVFAQQKTAKACRDEWKANKADNQAKGITEKAYVADCRAGTPATQPASAPATIASPAKPETSTKPPVAPTAVVPAAKLKPTPTTTASTAPSGANEFATEAQAKARCPSDTVVWVNLSSKIYHFAGTKSYGNTKKGAFMCEKDAVSAGSRGSKSEKRS
jgi:hypothetical protein